MEHRIESPQPLEEMLHADITVHSQLEKHTRRNWLILIATSLLSTVGLALAMTPVLRGDSNGWPWIYTNHVLLAGLSLLITGLAWYLTEQERRVTHLRSQLLDARRRELKYCKSYGRAVAQANVALHHEIDERKRIAEELKRLNETLEARVAERSEEARRRAEELSAAKHSLEDQNRRLRELYNTAHQFVDNVSHEFRTPLTVIKEYAAAIDEGLAETNNAEQRQYLDTIRHRVDDLGALVEDLLDISRIEADLLRTSRRPCRVEDICARVRPTLERKAAGANIRLELQLPAELPRILADPEKIGRVLINLGVNAIKFSDPGGVVRIWARAADGDREVEVGVTDHGPGIAPENLEIIFERFKQLDGHARSSTKGFGLGLNIVKELVQLHFGTLRVDSQLGQGSTFSFTVPREDPIRFLPVYLERVKSMRRDAAYVSLLTVMASTEVRTELQSVQAFLEDNIRRTDLLISTTPDAWILVAAMEEIKPDQVIARMERAHAEANRARVHTQLPALRWNLQGSWPLENPGSTFTSRFLALLPDASAAAARPPVPDAAGPTTR